MPMIRLLTAIALLVLVGGAFFSKDTTHAADASAGIDKGEVEAIVKNYLTSNPQIIVEALDSYQVRQEKLKEVKAQNAIKDNRAQLFDDPSTPRIGNTQNPDVTLAEFFDYRCGYCKRMVPVMKQLVAQDPTLQIVFHELPILSEDSKLAAKAAIAVYQLKPDSYFDYHVALMKLPGRFTIDKLADEANKLGIDEAAFKVSLNSPDVQKSLDHSREMATQLNIRGTPAMVVGEEFIGGAASVESLKLAIEKARLNQ